MNELSDRAAVPPSTKGGFTLFDDRLVRIGSTWIAVLAFLMTLAALQLFIFHFDRPYFSSDDAVVNTLAGSMWEQGRLFPRDWINNNGDLMIPSGALIVAPLLAWLPNGFVAHSIAGVFATLLMIGALATFLRAAAMPVRVILLLATVQMSAFSLSFEILIFVQTTYVWWPAGFFLGASIILFHRRRNDADIGKTYALSAAMAFLVFIISAANPGRVLLMMVGPLYVFDRVFVHASCKSSCPTFARRWADRLGFFDVLTWFGIGCGFFAAALLYALLAHYGATHASYAAAALRWGGWPSVLRHAETFTGWFSFLGAPSTSIFSGSPIVFVTGLFRWGIAVGLTWVGISEVIRLVWERDPIRRATAAALLASTVPIGFIYLLFDPLAVNGWTMRYFIVPYCIALVLTAFPIRSLLVSFPRLIGTGIAMACILLVLGAARIYLPSPLSLDAAFWRVRTFPNQQLADLLSREGFKWGYATWWNAGVTTVESNSLVHIVPVGLSKDAIVPFPSMVSTRWYAPEAWSGETFLALSQAEVADAKIQSLLYVLGKPLRTIDTKDFRILVFDHNISTDFGKSTKGPFAPPIERGDPAPQLLSAILRVDGSGKAETLVVKVRNETAFTISGAGQYRFSVGVQLLDANGAEIVPDWVNWPLPRPLAPGQQGSFDVPLLHASEGTWRIRVDLIQDRVGWLGNIGMPTFELPLDPDFIFGTTQ